MLDPLSVAVLTCGGFAALCWIASVFSGEHSWVDRLWSITPAVYAIGFALAADPGIVRLNLMAGLVALWGVRLTFNFARKGGYQPGGEDYRWAVLRESMDPRAFAVFNVVFICVFQHGLLLLLALPSWIALRQGPSALGWLDALATLLFLGFLAGETVADQQQWAFHRDKAARAAAGGPREPEFLTTGLFRYSRHPNFFCEQALWWSFYLFGVAAGAGWLNVSIVGPVLLTALFQGSAAFTESISASKYPAYAQYRRRTSRLLPWPPAKGT
jgi:steroid 5-alpha reductase family enzyme